MYEEISGDIWDFPYVKVITTNGNFKKNGKAVMGKGLALQASRNFKHLAKDLGAILKEAKIKGTDGNKCYYFSDIGIL